MAEKLLFAVFGAAIALISSWAKAWIDRETATSNELLKQRIQALNGIWLCFIKAKNTYSHKVTMGHAKWLERYKEEAQKDINNFRSEVDANQIVLPHEIIEALRNIDAYMLGVLDMDYQKPSEYVDEIERLLCLLSDKTNSALSKRTHKVNLKFRT